MFTTIELFIAGYITTNISYCPSNSSTNALFAFHEHSSKNTPVKSTSTDSSVSKYNKFVKNYSDDSVTENLSTLLSLATLSDNEKEKYCNTPFPDIFQEINGICKKLGISGTLFKKQTVSLKFSPSNKYTIVKESNDLYNISSPTVLPFPMVLFHLRSIQLLLRKIQSYTNLTTFLEIFYD